MILRLDRIKSDDDSTLGVLYINGEAFCFVIEDEKREFKVRGETRIPAGTYHVKKRKVLSDMTKKYRKRFDFFDYHFELQNVPDFKFVYIHIGNTDDHTEGCLLVNYKADMQKLNGERSAVCFEELYKKMSQADQVSITITDCD